MEAIKVSRVYEVSEVVLNGNEVSFLGTRYNVLDDGSIKVLSFGESFINIADNKDFVNDPTKPLFENVFEYAKTRVVTNEVDLIVLTEKPTTGDPDSGVAAAGSEQPSLYSFTVEAGTGADSTMGNTSGNEADAEGAGSAGTTAAPVTKVYAGKTIVSDTFRQVEGKSYHHVTLVDGSSYDLTNEEYIAQVTVVEA